MQIRFFKIMIYEGKSHEVVKRLASRFLKMTGVCVFRSVTLCCLLCAAGATILEAAQNYHSNHVRAKYKHNFYYT